MSDEEAVLKLSILLLNAFLGMHFTFLDSYWMFAMICNIKDRSYVTGGKMAI